MAGNGAMRMSGEVVHLLLIEDNEEHVQFLMQLLLAAETRFQPVAVGTLQEGLAKVAKQRFDLILLDLTLPDSEGLETFINVIDHAREVPIVVLSGVNDVALAVETVQLGAQDYLLKGHVDNHLLVRSLHYAMERKRIQLQLKHAYEELELRVQERTAALRDTNQRLQKEIAERKKAEEATLQSNRQLASALGQLKAAQDEIVERERMLALGRMANGIAHDFNNTLAPIVGFSELLLMKPEIVADKVKARSYLEMIHTASKDSARVVSRLREFYRFREKDEIFTPVVLNDVILQVVSMTQPRWKDQALAAGVNIEIRSELGNIPSVPGNEAEIREAITHLVFNAIDAIPKRGVITISSEVQGRWAVITVTDTGVGMTEEVRQKCMEPFFTTKQDQGTGLGLGTVYGTVRRHDGHVDIQSEPNRGTSVALSFPLDRQERAPEAPKVPSSSMGGLRILVVEDEPLVREVIGVYLAEDKHEVITANDGRQGLEKFKTEGKFDVVLTDRAMPEMNGDQLAVEIKKLAPGQCVILLTGFGDLMVGAGEQPPGVDIIVGKPFTLTTLRGAISKVLGK
jgi:signal transduction histidine kinase